MKKILVILTGGTIGSKVSSNDINIDSKTAYSLLERYREIYERETEFEVLSPYQVLSENMDLEYWMKLYENLNRISYEEYEGIIITHGSDTLSYTSNFLGYLYAEVPIPIILTPAPKFSPRVLLSSISLILLSTIISSLVLSNSF